MLKKHLLNANGDVSRNIRGLSFGLSLPLLPYFVYVKNKALACLYKCADSLESLLLADVLSTKILCTGPNILFLLLKPNLYEAKKLR